MAANVCSCPVSKMQGVRRLPKNTHLRTPTFTRGDPRMAPLILALNLTASPQRQRAHREQRQRRRLRYPAQADPDPDTAQQRFLFQAVQVHPH